MESILDRVLSWIDEGKRVALATVVEVERRAPRGPGAALAVSEHGEVAGSISGGCVEPALVEAAAEVIRTGEPRLVRFGISDEQAFEIGLACGGTLHVFVEPVAR